MKLGIVGNGVIVQEILTFIDEIGFDEIYICGRKASEDKLNAFVKDYGSFHMTFKTSNLNPFFSDDLFNHFWF